VKRRSPFILLLLAASLGPLEASQQSPQSPQSQDPPPKTRADDEPPRLKPLPPEQSTSLSPTILDRSSATVSVITGPDLQMLGVRTLTDALRIIPGLEIQKISTTESGVSVRGYSGPSSARQGILGLIDGRQVYNEFFGGVWWESLPITLDGIKAIEVIRGPSSFLYGPNAMYGLVNIVTKSPLDYDEGSTTHHDVFVTMAAGSYASNLETLTVVKREGDSGLKATIAHDDMDQFDGHRDTKNNLFADLRFRTKLDEHQQLELSAGASQNKFDVFFPRIYLDPTTPLAPATYTTHAREYFLKANYSFCEQLRVQASWTRFTADGQPDFVYMPFSLLLDTADLDAQYVFTPFDANRVTLGAGYRYTTFATRDSDVSDGRHATGLGWFFFQDEITVARELFFTAGARIDDHSVSGVSISPRVALVWEFVPPTIRMVDGVAVSEPGQSIRATASYGFRDPSLRDLWFDMQINPAGQPLPPQPGLPRVVGNRDLKPEEIRSFEAGYWGRPTARLQAECSVFYNLTDHLFAFQENLNPATGLPDGTASRHNVSNEETYGVEVNVEYQLTGEVFTFGNYAYEIRRNRQTHDRIHDAPRNKANAGVRVINEKGLSGMLWMNFFDRVDFTDKNTGLSLGSVPSYALLNAKVWYPIRLGNADGKLFLQAFNLLDNVHREYIQSKTYGLMALAGVEIAW
jgi:iron complex outermembrane receptor protein